MDAQAVEMVAQQVAGLLNGAGVILAVLIGLAVVMVISGIQMANTKSR